MAELDFDELDRAVNSLMSQAPVSVPAKQDDDVTTVELPDDSDAPAEPSASSKPSAAPAVNRTPAPAAPPVPAPEKPEEVPAPLVSQSVKPRRGRFMDMIHPSAAKEAEKLAAPSARPSREAKVVEPRSGGLIADIVKKPAQQSSSDASAASEPTEAAPEVTETALVATPDATPAETPTPSAPAGSDFSAFLPDAKVEKRPLGQPASSMPEADTAAPAEPDTAPAPEEYDQQLMAIESGNTKSAEPEPVSETLPATVEASEPPAAPTETPSELEPESVSAPETPVVAPEPKPTGPTSIAQQYQEQPSSSDQSNGAIYDTATYHQPLSHPAKKSSGWLWVILIIAIILIGAGAGAYIYLNGV